MKYIFLVDHPQQLVTAIGYQKLKKIPFSKSILIVSNHTYWKNVDKSIIYKYFKSHLFLERPDYSLFFPRQILRLIMARYKFGQFHKVESRDVFLYFSTCQFLENLFVSTYVKNQKLLIHPESTHLASIQPISSNMKELLMSRIANLFIFPIFGMQRTKYLVNKEDQVFGFKTVSRDGNSLLRYEVELVDIYDQVVVLKNKGDKLRKKGIYKEIYYPYSQFSSSKTKPNTVVFVGQPFTAFRNTDVGTYAKLTNKCLTYIKKKHPQANLIYKPHPRETRELQMLSLDKFTISKDSQIFELFLFHHMSKIAAVYGVSSTSIRSAHNFGIKAFAFFPLFPFEDFVKEGSYKLLGNLPQSHFLKSWKTPPL